MTAIQAMPQAQVKQPAIDLNKVHENNPFSKVDTNGDKLIKGAEIQMAKGLFAGIKFDTTDEDAGIDQNTFEASVMTLKQNQPAHNQA